MCINCTLGAYFCWSRVTERQDNECNSICDVTLHVRCSAILFHQSYFRHTNTSSFTLPTIGNSHLYYTISTVRLSHRYSINKSGYCLYSDLSIYPPIYSIYHQLLSVMWHSRTTILHQWLSDFILYPPLQSIVVHLANTRGIYAMHQHPSISCSHLVACRTRSSSPAFGSCRPPRY